MSKLLCSNPLLCVRICTGSLLTTSCGNCCSCAESIQVALHPPACTLLRDVNLINHNRHISQSFNEPTNAIMLIHIISYCSHTASCLVVCSVAQILGTPPAMMAIVAPMCITWMCTLRERKVQLISSRTIHRCITITNTCTRWRRRQHKLHIVKASKTLRILQNLSQATCCICSRLQVALLTHVF
jgi:hypothetical protein